ncbi:DUF3139 domain-containing protein [Paenibacillus sp. ACRRX]|uniref:DUF3139 domain-containing protein n=1 Tax=Paenibacillus TaxID=44249 RepID=UPI00048F41E4|nr:MULTISPECIES: DUF3139 domain-containing protein [Paenibacillus]MCG7410872.1 DUF3139 domain-containing protein [Paenibacillus sp. ACRRX]
MKKALIWSACIILILVGGIYSYYLIKVNSMEHSLKSYLMTEKNYKESDINSLTGKIAKAPKYSVQVIFSDEPSVIYIYTDHGTGKWRQLIPGVPESESGVPFKHYEPFN